MIAVNAVKGAVSQRRIRGPRVQIFIPAAFAFSISSSEKPPSAPVMRLTVGTAAKPSPLGEGGIRRSPQAG